MSNLENKLNASIQSPRRRSPTAASTTTPASAEKPAASKKPAPKTAPKVAPVLSDLNDGGGREINPQRIWPD
ncbi:hypothetical protein B1757_09690 [Acidithiobacillus marinus]|uniref:Uncharacterized protein n=1 Tax=Acidithiobacillus marinus TaxID=187490 RepID=A0A2I1DKF9_9PROT|nr:hypothetical protein [Acidithiobacillus marinus]PKY10367.1 hypothetical protein B1757_09690 [Acidithiobacillus marinus]